MYILEFATQIYRNFDFVHCLSKSVPSTKIRPFEIAPDSIHTPLQDIPKALARPRAWLSRHHRPGAPRSAHCTKHARTCNTGGMSPGRARRANRRRRADGSVNVRDGAGTEDNLVAVLLTRGSVIPARNALRGSKISR